MKSYDELIETNELYIDDNDKAHLKEMPEVQREKILYTRYNSLKAANEKKQLEEMTKPTSSVTVQKVFPLKVKFEDCDFIVSRDLLISNVFKPTFSLFKGCFVRININNEDKICKIIGIKEKEPYIISKNDNTKCTTAISLDTGVKIYKEIEINIVSSRRIQQEEFEEFVRDFKITALEDLKLKYKRVLSEMNRQLTDNEITETIQNRLKANPKKKSNTQIKIDLILKRDSAIAERNRDKAFHYQKQIENMEDNAKDARKRKYFEEMQEVKKRLQNK